MLLRERALGFDRSGPGAHGRQRHGRPLTRWRAELDLQADVRCSNPLKPDCALHTMRLLKQVRRRPRVTSTDAGYRALALSRGKSLNLKFRRRVMDPSSPSPANRPGDRLADLAPAAPNVACTPIPVTVFAALTRQARPVRGIVMPRGRFGGARSESIARASGGNEMTRWTHHPIPRKSRGALGCIDRRRVRACVPGPRTSYIAHCNVTGPSLAAGRFPTVRFGCSDVLRNASTSEDLDILRAKAVDSGSIVVGTDLAPGPGKYIVVGTDLGDWAGRCAVDL